MDLSRFLQYLRDNRSSCHLTATTLNDPNSPESDTAFRSLFRGLWGDTATVDLSSATVDDKQGAITLTRPNTPFPVIRVPGLLEGDEPDIAVASVPCELTAEFFMSGGEVHATLTFRIALFQNVFKQVFPNLPYAFKSDNDDIPGAPKDVLPILHGESLTKVCFIFNTHDVASESMRAGLNIRAKWRPTKLTPAQDMELDLQGYLVMPDPQKPTPPLANGAMPWDETTPPPGIHLHATLTNPHPLWGGNSFTNPEFVFYSPLTRNWPLQNWSYEPEMAYTGEVWLGKLPNGSDIRGTGALCAQTWEAFTTYATLTCTFKGATLTSVDDVLALGKNLLQTNESLNFQALPENITIDNKNTPALKRAFIRMENNKLTSAGFTIALGNAATWNIIDREMTAEFTEISIVVAKETTGLHAWGALTGRLTMWGAELEMSVEAPGFTIRARQVGDINVKLADIFQRNAKNGFPTLRSTNVVIKDMRLSVIPAFNPVSYQFSLRLQGALPETTEKELPYIQLSLSNTEWSLYGSAEEKGFPIGQLLKSLAEKVAPTIVEMGVPKDLVLPETIKSFTVTSFNLRVHKNEPGQKNEYSFFCAGQLEVSGKQIRAGVSIEFAQGKDTYNGWLSIGTRMFSFTVGDAAATNTAPASSQMVAAYTHWGGEALGLGELMKDLVAEETATALNVLKVDLKDAFLGYIKTGQTPSKSNYLFGVDLSAKLDFSKLPLVGERFSTTNNGDGIGINNLQVIYAKDSFTADEVTKLDAMLPQSIAKKSTNGAEAPRSGTSGNNAAAVALNPGLNIAADLNLGFTSQRLAFPTAANTGLPNGADATVSPQATNTDNATWLNIHKAVGPVHFERVGVEYHDSKLWALLSASLNAAGLTIALDGLSIGAPLDGFDPAKIETSLRGLGIDYRNEAVEIGGSFLKMPSKDGAPPEYSGAAILKARGFTISAFGSYTTVKESKPGQPDKEESSFFIYGLLDYPIGGPSFFFVTGLAAGFGYNRSLIVPPIDKLRQFSLIKAAQKDPATKTFDEVLSALHEDVRPAAGEHFLAAGITFTSFNIVTSFALLTVSFGAHFEMNLLGLSTLVAPSNAGSNVPPVAEAQLALKASFQPDKGFLGVQAQLTPNSYLLSKACHLTGGFAFYSWFAGSEHDGDFALTLGGYHPNFKVPTHYPTVPRLGFNWQVSPELSLKGDAYFALTASALMAGGHLEANWLSSSVHAWFKLGADFLIAWKPYHYEIAAYVDMGVEVTFEFFGTQHISIDVGADLSIWGPEFTGEATIHLWIISFTVKFGAAASHKPQPIEWPEFKSSFLPADENVCSVAVTGGLIGKNSQDAKDLGVINPKAFSLAINTVIPLKEAWYARESGSLKIDLGTRPLGQCGIAPMDVKAADLTSKQTITIKRDGAVVSDEFDYTPIFKKVPTGLWGGLLTPKLNEKQFIENALSGFEIRPKIRSKPAETAAIERRRLQDGGFSRAGESRWESVKPFVAASFDSELKRRDELRKSLTASAASRKATLAALGFTPDDLGKIDLSAAQADEFLIAPQIEQI
ncbi:MAG TPA: DUF6603 domain-containing protein [Blastocatellia bacterium]|nr:DUF6603 domain-containing protein [Blastocatellia bacterium]